MIKDLAAGDRPSEEFIHDTVDPVVTAVDASVTVSVAVLRANPFPTPRHLIGPDLRGHLSRKAGGVHRVHSAARAWSCLNARPHPARRLTTTAPTLPRALPRPSSSWASRSRL